MKDEPRRMGVCHHCDRTLMLYDGLCCYCEGRVSILIHQGISQFEHYLAVWAAWRDYEAAEERRWSERLVGLA